MSINSYKENVKLAEHLAEDLIVEINGETHYIRIFKVSLEAGCVGPNIEATIIPASSMNLSCSTIED